MKFKIRGGKPEKVEDELEVWLEVDSAGDLFVMGSLLSDVCAIIRVGKGSHKVYQILDVNLARLNLSNFDRH